MTKTIDVMRLEIVEDLKRIQRQANSKLKPPTGICGQLHLDNDLKDRVVFAMTRWPEYSGCPIYPVKGKRKYEYNYAYGAGTLWTGRYGARRKRLLKFLIQYFERA